MVLVSRLWYLVAVCLIAASTLELVPRNLPDQAELVELVGTISRVDFKNSMHRLSIVNAEKVESAVRISPTHLPSEVQLAAGQQLELKLDPNTNVVHLVVDGCVVFTHEQYIRREETIGKRLAIVYLLLGLFLGIAAFRNRSSKGMSTQENSSWFRDGARK